VPPFGRIIRSLGWWVIGASIFASDIGRRHRAWPVDDLAALGAFWE